MKTLSLALSALLLCPPVWADVMLKTAFKSGGFRGMGGSEGKSTRWVSGEKAREEGDSRLSGAVLGRLSGSKESASILRVDKDKLWTLDLKKKTYTESPIKLEMPKEAERTGGGKPGKDEKPTHRVKSAKAEVKKTGEAKTINGFKTGKWAATLVVVIEELETKKTAEYAMTTDVWATPWTQALKQAVAEEARFAKAYAKKLGLELSPEERARYGADGARMLLAASGPEVEGALRKLGKGLGDIDGYPIVTESTWRNPAADAPKKKAAPEPEEDDDGSAVSDAAGAGSLGGAAMGFLGGMAKKAAKKKVKQKVQEHMDAAAGKPAFSVRTEVLAVEVAPVPAEKFELPEGFKKKG